MFRSPHLVAGSRRLAHIHSSSQARPRHPLRRVMAAAPWRVATPGSHWMAAALPMYMPDVVSDTAVARSLGGMHCTAASAALYVSSSEGLL